MNTAQQFIYELHKIPLTRSGFLAKEYYNLERIARSMSVAIEKGDIFASEDPTEVLSFEDGSKLKISNPRQFSAKAEFQEL